VQTAFVPLLTARGVAAAEVRQILVANPCDLLTVHPAGHREEA
jgi:predicted metal-dependent phosphotriesterase family hydrolase